MKRCLQLSALMAMATLPATSAVMTWYGALSPGNEVTSAGTPAPLVLNGATPSGFGTVTFDSSTNLLTIDLSWEGLTGEARAAHIHCCVATPPGTAGVVLGLWNPPMGAFRPASGSYSNSWDLDTDNPFTNATFVTNNGGTPLLAFMNGLVPAMNAGTPEVGRAYFNIHTELNPGGEIRGNLAPVPEPSSMLFMLSGGLGLLALRRFRK